MVVFNNLSSMCVNEELDICLIYYLDINYVDIVVCIDFIEWEINLELICYLIFLKGWVGCKVVDFFMDFFGVSEGFNVKV